MVSSQRDTALATVLSLISVGVLYIAIFWEVWSPLRVQIALQLAICWSLGWATLTVGHLNILSVSFARFSSVWRITWAFTWRRVIVRNALPAMIFVPRWRSARQWSGHCDCGISVALAFYAVMLANFPGLAELGFIAGSGELLCMVASFTVLPALFAVSQRYLRTRAAAWQAKERRSWSWSWPGRYPRLTLAGIGVLILISVLVAAPKFDYNLLHLQAKGTESVVWENRLLEESGHSSRYALSTADSLEELRRKKARFEALPVVDRVEVSPPCCRLIRRNVWP